MLSEKKMSIPFQASGDDNFLNLQKADSILNALPTISQRQGNDSPSKLAKPMPIKATDHPVFKPSMSGMSELDTNNQVFTSQIQKLLARPVESIGLGENLEDADFMNVKVPGFSRHSSINQNEPPTHALFKRTSSIPGWKNNQ